MTSDIGTTNKNANKQSMMQPALPVVPSKAINGRADSLASTNPNQSADTGTKGTDRSEESGNREGAGHAIDTDTARATESLIAGSSRRVSVLPRSASTGNIGGLRVAALSQNSDRPEFSHTAVEPLTIEDPFLSPAPDRQLASFYNTSATPPQVDRVHAIQQLKTPDQDISPRQDRLGQEVTPANAQGVHTPAACVFMANLSSQRTLEQLEYSVAKAMDIYGKCYVKVQFDKNKMPYAFVQFEEEEDARICLTNAKGLVIDGRPIRVEHARAQRKSIGAIYLSKITGGPVTNEEARSILGRFGAIEETCPTTVADQQMHGLPEGIWVKFVYFMDCKDAIAEFRHNQFYKLHVPEKNEQSQHGVAASPSYNRGANRGYRNGSDAKAIFVGGLPATITDDQLREVFNPYGNVLDCKVIRKSLGGDQVNVFAFVEFRTVTEAQASQEAELTVAGIPLRIEPKRYTMRRAARNSNYNNTTTTMTHRSPITFTSPNYQSPIYHGSSHSNSIGNRPQYDTSLPAMYNNGKIGYTTTTQSPHIMSMRSGPPPLMSPYTQYPSPHYTSPITPRGPSGYDMHSAPPMYHAAAGPAPTYYGPYLVGGAGAGAGPPGFNPGTGMSMGYGGMQAIAEHEGEMGPGGF